MWCRQYGASLYIKSQGCTMTYLLFPGCLHGFRGVRVQPQALCQAGDQGLRSFPETAHAIQLPQGLRSQQRSWYFPSSVSL